MTLAQRLCVPVVLGFVIPSVGQFAGAGGDLPLGGQFTHADDISSVVQRHSRADVPGDSVQQITHSKVTGSIGLQGEMFLAVYDRLGIVQPDEFHPWVRVFGGDALVAEVQRDAVATRFADHAGEQHGRLLEFEVGELFCVTKIPKQRGAGAALVRGCLLYTSPSPRDATLSRMPSSA